MLDVAVAAHETEVVNWSLAGYWRVPRPMRLGPAPRALDILFIYSRPPLPMTRGDELTVAHLLEFLAARGHRVDLISLIPKGEALKPEHQRWLESRCRSVCFVEQGKIEALWQGFKGWLGGWPFQIGYLLVPEQLRAVRKAAMAHRHDLAYAYYIRSAEALRRLEGCVPCRVLALQLSQTLNTERLATNAAQFFVRLFYRVESRRMAAYESRIWQTVDRTVLIGEKDRAAIEAACRQHGERSIDNVVFGPHGVDTERFRPRPEAEEADTVVMSGVMRYAPNVEAALWFLNEVWPTVRKVRPEARFWLVGRDPVPAVAAWHGHEGVTVTGTVDEPADWIARATVCVAPIRATAGLQNKLLEALAMGKAMVATPEANEGIRAQPNKDLVIAKEPAAFARAVLELLGDAGRRQILGASGRAYVEAHWTWEKPFLALERAFFELLQEKAAAQPFRELSTISS